MISPSLNYNPLSIAACGQYEFSCQSGDCIAVYDVCNGIAQCADGSDEDPSVCPSNVL